MKIGIAQIDTSGDSAANLALIKEAAAQAAADGGELVVLPEGAMYMPAELGLVQAVAEPLTGDFVRGLSAIARSARISVVAGVWERVQEKVYNTIVVLNSDGDFVARYRKVHLYDAFSYRESEYVAPSEDLAPVTFRSAGLTIGIATCYDLRFPESFRALVDAGADVVLLPAAWVPGPLKEDQWTALARARAIENTSYVVAVNQTPPIGTGRSVVVDPSGVVVGELADVNDVRVFDIDPARIEAVRERNPSLANRRFSVTPTR